MLKLESVLVTGASRGIGRSVAELLVARHPGPLRLVLCSRDAGALDAAAGELRAGARAGIEVVTQPMDVADPASVSAGFAAVASRAGPLEGLVLCAGIAESAPLHRTGDELWERVMAVNAGGVFRCMRAALPDLRARGRGRIVVIGSIASKMGGAYIAAYCASKHAVLGLVRAAAVETAAHGITVNLVCPGYVDTPMTGRSLRNIARKTGLSEAEALEKILARSPQRRLITPEEVAEAVLFLLSEEARGITGSTIDVDGGELAQ